MDELTFLLILAGIGVVLLIAMFTYYKHHKKIHDEIKDFNHHSHDIDDVLLTDHSNHSDFQPFDSPVSTSSPDLLDDDLPGSFTATKNDSFDLDNVNFDQTSVKNDKVLDERELVDGVYINTKRVISKPNQSKPNISTFKKTTDTFSTFAQSKKNQPEASQPQGSSKPSILERSQERIANPESSTVQQSTDKQTVQPKVSPKETANTVQQELIDNLLSDKQKIKVVYDPVPEGVQELIISHTILAKNEHFTGTHLFKAITSAGLSFGEMNIFHYPGTEEPETFALFSIANVVEPGTFSPEEAETFTTPGISMFMRLPTRTDSYKAYEEFIHIAQLIASELDGELCDETRSILTQQAITYKKEQIRKLNFDIAKAEKLAGMS